MTSLLKPTAFLSLLLAGAVFGFFYAWVCSTMWGLDAIDPRIAIAAMNGMNDSVRNAVFAPAFFGTPVALIVTAVFAKTAGRDHSAWAFGLAAALYIVGAFAVTVVVNVPMNRALLDTAVPDDIDAARAIWTGYSGRWQIFNTLRTALSAGVLLLTGWGVFRLGAERAGG